MNCLIHGRYNMSFDVLHITRTQRESGEIVRQWVVGETGIPCIARGISGGGIRVVGSTERWGDTHEDVEVVKMQTSYNLSKRDRITNIRTSNGRLGWEDEGEATVFDVVGSTPIFDPFGALVEYDVLLMRAEVQ